MELKVTLNENADIPFIKKLLHQLKGVKSFEFLEQKTKFVNDNEVEYGTLNKKINEEDMSDNEYENLFNQLLEKSFNQIDEGKFVEHSEELMDNIFKK